MFYVIVRGLRGNSPDSWCHSGKWPEFLEIITININQYGQTVAGIRTGYPPSACQTHNCFVVIEVSCKILTLCLFVSSLQMTRLTNRRQQPVITSDCHVDGLDHMASCQRVPMSVCLV